MASEASTTNWVMPGSSASMSLNILANTGTTSQSMTVTAITATSDQDQRIHRAPFDLALGLAGFADLLVELGEHLGHLAGDFAGADRLEPLKLEDLGECGRRRVKRASGRNLGGDLIQDGPELDALALSDRDLQGLQERSARADQGRELVKERQRVFELGALVRLLRDPRMGHDPFLERQSAPRVSRETARSRRRLAVRSLSPTDRLCQHSSLLHPRPSLSGLACARVRDDLVTMLQIDKHDSAVGGSAWHLYK